MSYKQKSPMPVVEGATGSASFVAYAPVCGGTTTTGALQSADSGISTSGYVLTSTGSSSLPTWQAAAGGSSNLTFTTVNHAASPYTVLSGDVFIEADVTAGVITILLPNAPTTGRVIYIKDIAGLAATSNITVTTVGGSVAIDDGTSYVMNTTLQSENFTFNGTKYYIF